MHSTKIISSISNYLPWAIKKQGQKLGKNNHKILAFTSYNKSRLLDYHWPADNHYQMQYL